MKIISLSIIAVVGFAVHGVAWAGDTETAAQIRQAQFLQKSTKLDTALLPLLQQARLLKQNNNRAEQNSNPQHTVDLLVTGSTDSLRGTLHQLGMTRISVGDHVISGQATTSQLAAIEQLPQVRSVRPFGGYTRQGSVRTQGLWAGRAGAIDTLFDLRGEGMKIAVMSDSYDCLGGASKDILTEDIPADVVVVQELDYCESGTDEGRALIQVMVDIAPKASYYFHTGIAGGSEGNAAAILRLQEEFDVDVIVDDFASYYEPMFQDDATTQAIDTVVQQGVVYVTAAGNAGSNSYEQVFRPVYDPVLDVTVHDFDPGPGADASQLITIPQGQPFTLVMQWDQPYYSISGGKGSEADLDVFLIDARSATVVASSATNNIGNDPIEVLQFMNPESAPNDKFKLVIAHANGIAPGIVKYILPVKFGGSIDQYHTKSSTLIGHSNASGAITVGATHYRKTIVLDNPVNEVDTFSSLGGTPIIYSASGQRLEGFAIIRRKPDVTAPNAVNTTFYPGVDIEGDNKPNFYGTSASAPHVAALAALILQGNPDLTPAHVKHIIHKTARDVTAMGQTPLAAGFDYRSGYGLIHSESAVRKALKTIPETPITTVASQVQYPLPSLESTTDITPVSGSGLASGAGSLSAAVLAVLSVLSLLLKHSLLADRCLSTSNRCSRNRTSMATGKIT